MPCLTRFPTDLCPLPLRLADWNILSMAVVFPISQGIVMGFSRRERALVEFSNLLGNLRALWGAVHHWQIQIDKSHGGGWKTVRDEHGARHSIGLDQPVFADTGPSMHTHICIALIAFASLATRCRQAAEIWAETPSGTADMHKLFGQFLASQICYFDMPRFSRARERFDASDPSLSLTQSLLSQLCRRVAHVNAGHAIDIFGGKEEQARLRAAIHEQKLLVDSGVGRLQKLVQAMKVLGLPGGEAHRLDQYVSKVGVAFEQLTCLKEYRTPQVSELQS